MLISIPFANPSGLLLALAKSSAITVIGGTIALLLRRRSAAVRHQVWVWTLVLVIVSGAGGILPWRYEVRAPQLTSLDNITARTGVIATPVLATRSTTIARVRSQTSLLNLSAFITVVWLFGVISLVVRLIIVRMRLGVLWRRSEPARDAMLATFNRFVREIPNAVSLRLSQEVDVPVTWGVIAKRVILPECCSEWTPSGLEHVLRHELAHVKRLDAFSQLLAEMACALYWFNPLVWKVAKAMRLDCEIACDDIVLASGIRPADYASELVSFAADLRFGRVRQTGLTLVHRPEIEHRLQAILNNKLRRRLPRVAVFGLVVVAMGAVGIAAVHLQEPVQSGRLTKGFVNSKVIAFMQVLAAGDAASAERMAQADPALVNESGPNGETPLMAVLMSNTRNKEQLAKMVVGLGANVNARDEGVGLTPLSLAVRNPSIVRLLIANGADVHIRDVYGRGPIDYAAFGTPWDAEQRASADVLLRNGATMRFQDAVVLGKSSFVAADLIKEPSLATSTIHWWPAGFDPDETALEVTVVCLGYDHTLYGPIVEELASRITDPTFFQAVMLGDFELAANYVSREPTVVNQTAADGITIGLNWAIRADNRSLSTFLLDHGAKPNWLALRDAIRVGDSQIINVLLKHGADPHWHIPGQMNLTMFQYANAVGRRDIAPLVR